MTDNTQPEALRLADTLDLAPENGIEPQTAEDAAAELRRQHSENETLRVERERNLNSIRVCNEIINKKNAEFESLSTGYAAARLEIESLRARGVESAGEYPALPKPGHRGPEGTGSYFDSFTADQMRAYVDADRAMRAAQPAGAALDEREAFELWARPRGLQLRRNDALGHYGNIDTQRCWEGWQARAPADSVLEDAALLKEARDALWQPANVALCERIDACLDAARKQGANHD